eukprot:2574068-Rhodomonas_salina.1
MSSPHSARYRYRACDHWILADANAVHAMSGTDIACGSGQGERARRKTRGSLTTFPVVRR